MVFFIARYSMLCQRHVHARAHSPSPLPRRIVHVCTHGPSTLEAFISSRSTSSSPCRAGACAGAEVNSNHHLSTLTIESSIPSCVHITMQSTLHNAAMVSFWVKICNAKRSEHVNLVYIYMYKTNTYTCIYNM